MKVYKIRDLVSGLYATAGASRSDWSTFGKIWVGIGPLKSHLNLAKYKYMRNNCKIQIIEYDLVQSDIISIENIKPEWVVEDIIEK